MISQVINLSEEEKARIAGFQRGQGLFFAGRAHVAIRFRPSDLEDKLCTPDPEALRLTQTAAILCSTASI